MDRIYEFKYELSTLMKKILEDVTAKTEKVVELNEDQVKLGSFEEIVKFLLNNEKMAFEQNVFLLKNQKHRQDKILEAGGSLPKGEIRIPTIKDEPIKFDIKGFAIRVHSGMRNSGFKMISTADDAKTDKTVDSKPKKLSNKTKSDDVKVKIESVEDDDKEEEEEEDFQVDRRFVINLESEDLYLFDKVGKIDTKAFYMGKNYMMIMNKEDALTHYIHTKKDPVLKFKNFKKIRVRDFKRLTMIIDVNYTTNFEDVIGLSEVKKVLETKNKKVDELEHSNVRMVMG